jgi:cob(I)alamin adenosyltransferase
MVTLNKIYTRSGDAGLTGLGTGERRRKDDPRIEAYGAVDEANSFIGMARAIVLRAPEHAALAAAFAAIQNDLFDLGADLCVPEGERRERSLRITEPQVDRLEREIDALNADLEPLKSFVLPGGSEAAAAVHIARAMVRRAERRMVTLAAAPGEKVGVPALKYINRLSDFLFVAARHLNRAGEGDILWVPGAGSGV